ADDVLDKLLVALQAGKLIDGHSPGISGKDLNAYMVSGIHTDHECSTTGEMLDRLSRGMYILLREGSACHNLRTLLKAVTPANSRRCILCSDDRQPETILKLGHLDNHLRICVEEGLAIVPGLRGDIVLVDNLQDFRVQRVFICGEEVAAKGVYLPPVEYCDNSTVRGSFHVKDFSIEKLKLSLQSSHVHVIDILPGGVVTGKGIADVTRNEQGEFVYQPEQDIVKVAVVERHHNTGNVAVALLRGYGIQSGAVALSIAHDSHNIIVVGVNDEDMTFAVEQLVKQGGGIILARDRKIVDSMPMVVGGIMSDQSGEWVSEKLKQMHEAAYVQLGISREVEPIMTLCFMSLAVIPELKLTDMGLFDVTKFGFIPLEAD
ncbi:MAG: ade, partial [Firmicutes bacterium]|nr:ade [Bacillota bacterium]